MQHIVLSEEEEEYGGEIMQHVALYCHSIVW